MKCLLSFGLQSFLSALCVSPVLNGHENSPPTARKKDILMAFDNKVLRKMSETENGEDVEYYIMKSAFRILDKILLG